MNKPKITRSALKEVIKECLIEILAEGISPGIGGKPAPSKKRKTTRKVAQPRSPAKTTPEFDNAISKTASSLTSDPVMAAIFEDTARTTLQEQREGPGAAQSMIANSAPGSQVSNDVAPEDLFEGSSNWATLAFAEKKPV